MHSPFPRFFALGLVSLTSFSLLATLAYQELTHGVGFSSTPTVHTLDPDEDDRGSGRLSSQAASQALFSFRGSGRIDSDQDNAGRVSPRAQPTTYVALDSGYQGLATT